MQNFDRYYLAELSLEWFSRSSSLGFSNPPSKQRPSTQMHDKIWKLSSYDFFLTGEWAIEMEILAERSVWSWGWTLIIRKSWTMNICWGVIFVRGYMLTQETCHPWCWWHVMVVDPLFVLSQASLTDFLGGESEKPAGPEDNRGVQYEIIWDNLR